MELFAGDLNSFFRNIPVEACKGVTPQQIRYINESSCPALTSGCFKCLDLYVLESIPVACMRKVTAYVFEDLSEPGFSAIPARNLQLDAQQTAKFGSLCPYLTTTRLYWMAKRGGCAGLSPFCLALIPVESLNESPQCVKQILAPAVEGFTPAQLQNFSRGTWDVLSVDGFVHNTTCSALPLSFPSSLCSSLQSECKVFVSSCGGTPLLYVHPNARMLDFLKDLRPEGYFFMTTFLIFMVLSLACFGVIFKPKGGVQKDVLCEYIDEETRPLLGGKESRLR